MESEVEESMPNEKHGWNPNRIARMSPTLASMLYQLQVGSFGERLYSYSHYPRTVR